MSYNEEITVEANPWQGFSVKVVKACIFSILKYYYKFRRRFESWVFLQKKTCYRAENPFFLLFPNINSMKVQSLIALLFLLAIAMSLSLVVSPFRCSSIHDDRVEPS